MFTSKPSWGKIEYSGNKIILAQHDEIRRDFWDYSGATFFNISCVFEYNKQSGVFRILENKGITAWPFCDAAICNRT